MSDTNLRSHPQHAHIGPASLCLYNEITDHLRIIGKVDNIILNKLDPTNVFLTEVIDSQTVNTEGQPTFCGFQLAGTLREVLEPSIAYLMMKDCGIPTQESGCSIKTATEEYIAYPGRCIKLKHNAGFYSTGALPGPDAVTAAAGGVGGTIPTDGYYLVVTCMYGTTESEYTESNLVNVVLGEMVTVTITPPTGLTPDSYRVYVYNDAETRADATLLVEAFMGAIDPIIIVFDDFPRTGALYSGDATASFIIEDSDENVLVANTDYTVDTSCGVVCFPLTGDVEEGELLTVTYTYRSNPYVEMSIGPSATLPNYVHPVILALKNDDRAEVRERGVELHLWKVLPASAWSWDLSTLSFESGFDFTWDVLFSEKNFNHGKITLINRHLENYDLANLGALTDWANAAGCDES